MQLHLLILYIGYMLPIILCQFSRPNIQVLIDSQMIFVNRHYYFKHGTSLAVCCFFFSMVQLLTLCVFKLLCYCMVYMDVMRSNVLKQFATLGRSSHTSAIIISLSVIGGLHLGYCLPLVVISLAILLRPYISSFSWSCSAASFIGYHSSGGRIKCRSD